MNRTLHCETVYHLKNELEMGSGLQFGQGMPPSSTITSEFVDALLDHYQTFISFPEREAESQEHINKFAEYSDFPQVVGAIDGTHIEIKRPDEHFDDYMNHKGYYSVLLQGIADADYKFLDVTVGYAGSMHDARMLLVSSFFPQNSKWECT